MPPTLLELSMKEMAQGQRFEEYAAKWRAQAAKHIPPNSEAQQIQLFHFTLRGVYYSHLLAHTSSFSDLIEAWKKLDLGIKLGRMEDPTSKGEESSKKAPAVPSSSGGRRAKEVSVNAVNTAHQAPQQYSVNLTTTPTTTPTYFPPPPQHQPQSIYYSATPIPPPTTSQPYDHFAPTSAQPSQPRPPVSRAPPPAQQNPTSQGQQAGGTQSRPCKQYSPLPAPLSHIYRQLLAGNQIQPISPEEDRQQQTHLQRRQAPECASQPLPDYRPNSGPFINMISICASGRDEEAQENPLPFMINYTPEELIVGFTGHVASPVYGSSAAKDKGKAPAVEVGAASKSSPFPPKKVTEEEAEAFMKIVKVSEYKVVEQMAKSPAHISLLAPLLGSEPHREALLRVLTAAQVPKETPPDRIEETVGSIFSNTISFSDDELPSEGWSHSRALHIVCKCNNYIIGRVMIDNGSALNVCLVTTLKQMNVDLNRVRPSKTAVLLRNNYIPGTGLGARGQGINRPIEVEGYKHRRGLGFHPSCHEIIEARKGNHLHRLTAYYGRLNKGTLVPPLSHFFPGPSHTIGGTLDGPSSNSDDTPVTPSAVYAVTEEIPSGVHIRLAQENEELDNWTSVPRYLAVIADV
ncbi:hypothetical protein CRG98_015318 [Punica granatum]|uniref:G-patch domain-containing protein n=1 Tax=Punica granatum TaxID=22663 RepID=A0A2I0K6U8_PUNGR|nr:hypothetical protein CRG98_015318 [Punica granatum]